MTEAIYQWMKNLAVFYIFLTVVMNLVPDSQYGEYVKFFMGLLLILLIMTPVLHVLNMEENVGELFKENTRQQEELNEKWMDMQQSLEEAGALQEEYFNQWYESQEAEGYGEEAPSLERTQ